MDSPLFYLSMDDRENKNNASGIFWVFALTGWLGFTLGPILNMYLPLQEVSPL